MKKLTRIAAIFIVVASFFVWTAPVSAATTDHLGGTWTPPDASSISGVHLNISTFTIGTGTVTVSGSVEIQCQTANINGTLTATGQGYATNSGPGAGTSCATKSGAGGGGYGGAGGNGDSGILGGSAYGSSLAPIDMGSGGGTSGVTSGGAGGGAIIIHCIGNLAVGGVIEANGNPGAGLGNDASGGGAGGSIYITAGTISGTGSITADGGAGDSTKYLGGGGGGGIIAIHLGSGSFGGTTSAVGGTATSPALPGGVGTTTAAGTTLWRTYKDSGYLVYLDVFSDYGTEHTVYVKGTGLPSDTYIIVFWDASGVKIQVDTQAGTEISSSRTFVDASDPEGTWYASVYVVATPAAHTGTSGETNNLKADYAFYAYQSAIPEFSTVMAAIGVAGLCFGIYFWMRKKFKKQNEKFKIRAQRDLG